MPLTQPQLEALQLTFEDRLTDIVIAKRIEIDVKTLRNWRELPEFIAEHEILHKQFMNRAGKRLLASREARLNAKIDRHNLLTNIIEQRAAAADPNVPGADTGLLIKRTYTTKEGTFEEYRIDHATIRELSRLEDQIAKDLRQDKTPPEVIVEEPNEDLSCLTNEEIDVMIMIDDKVIKHNPHLKGPAYRELTNYELVRTNRSLQKVLEQKTNNGQSELKTA